MISSLVFAGTYNASNGDYTVTINKGWNLVPSVIVKYDATNPNCFTSGLSKTIFYYSPSQQKYVGPDLSMDKPENYNIWAADSQAKYYTATPYLGAVWVYSNEECSYMGGIGSASMFNEAGIKTLKIAKGWNFINVHPWMIGKNLQSIFNNCNLVAANAWQSLSQTWGATSSAVYASQIKSGDEQPIISSMIGQTLVIKVASDCYLNYGSDTTAPPVLPN